VGRRLLVDAARGQSEWHDRHLAARLFDTRSSDPTLKLTAQNFDDVAYATTRMLHAWPVPAAVDGQPYVDASYTCLCPAVEVAALGYADVIAIATEAGPIARNMFDAIPIPLEWNGSRIRLIQPDVNLAEFGVEFSSATEDGIARAFEHGIEKGRAFAQSLD